jgi:hypothetical protein
MLSNRSRLIPPAILGLAALLSPIPSARGGSIIPEHATAEVLGVYGRDGQGLPGVVSDGPNSGPLSANAAASGSFGGFNPGTTVAASGASNAVLVPAGPSGGSSWQLNARAEMDVRDGVPGFNDGGFIYAAATWRDVLILSDNDPRIVGNTVRLTFRTSGTLVADVVLDGMSGGGTSSVTMSASGQYRDLSGRARASIGLAGVDQSIITSGWDSVAAGPNFSGTWHVDIPIDGNLGYQNIPGALYYEVNLTAQVDSQGFYADLLAEDPTRFASITLPDVGNVTPESLGVSITFDSGIASPNLTAVPEPSSIVMLGIGALGVLGYGWRRRRA